MRFLYDTHVHTKESSHCGEVLAKDVVSRYKSLGYDGIIITDHMNKDTLVRYGGDYQSQIERWKAGYNEAKKYETESFHIIHGMEFRALKNDNDYLVYGFDEDIFNKYRFDEIESIKDFMVIAKENNLIVFQAHPFRNNMTVVKPGIVDGVEVYNGHKNHDSRNSIAYVWAERFDMKKISGSDFHGNIDGEPGGVYFSENPATSADVARILKNGEYSLKVYEK